MTNTWVRHASDVAYENPWIRVEHDTVTTPGGSPGVYGVVRFKNNAVGVIPIDDDGYTWLVGQHRYTVDEYTWEMPAGGCPVGESIEATAHRELAEETGLRAARLVPMFQNIQLTNSVTDERAWCFVARDLRQLDADPEDTEDLAVRRLPVSDAIEMALRNEIVDAFTLMALLWLAARPGLLD